MRNFYIRISGLIFFMVACLHAWRFLMEVPMMIGTTQVRLDISAVAALVSGLLAITAFKVR